MKLLYTLFYNYTRWFGKVHFSKANATFRAFTFMGILIIIAVSAIADTIILYFNYSAIQNHRGDFILLAATIIFVVLYFILLFDGKAKKIIDARPKLFNSDELSVLITILFTIFCLGTIIPVMMH